MKKHDEMSLEECRDELRRHLGWKRVQNYWTDGQTKMYGIDPVDATLDDIAAAMPEGWTLEMKQESQSAFPGVTWWTCNAFHMRHGFAVSANIPGVGKLSLHADTEILARARLAVACHRAQNH